MHVYDCMCITWLSWVGLSKYKCNNLTCAVLAIPIGKVVVRSVVGNIDALMLRILIRLTATIFEWGPHDVTECFREDERGTMQGG